MTNYKILFSLSLSFLLFSFISERADAQNLFEERIRKIPYDKKAVYFDGGIFHNGVPAQQEIPTLTGLRNHYASELGHERLVFDFTTNAIPRMYAYFDAKMNKLYLSLFKTQVREDGIFGGDSSFVRAVNFFLIDEGDVSIEILFKHSVGLEIFYLHSYGRLVVDVKA